MVRYKFQHTQNNLFFQLTYQRTSKEGKLCYDQEKNKGEAMKENNQGKIALVTGATGAIGKAIARQLAAKKYTVVLVARDELKAQITIADINNDTGNENLRYEIADLSKLEDIEALAERWQGPLHILVNDAAVTPPTRQENQAGIELQFATNVLGYFRMTYFFQEILHSASPARIVDVASYWAGGLRLDDLQFTKRSYSNGAAYRQSKQANRMLVAAWADHLAPRGIAINACHPGDVRSTLSRNLGFGGFQSPDQGAETPVWLATSPVGGQVSGKYFENKTQKTDPFTVEKDEARALFDICLTYQ